MTCRTGRIPGRETATPMTIRCGSIEIRTDGTPVSTIEGQRLGSLVQAVLDGDMSVEEANSLIKETPHK